MKPILMYILYSAKRDRFAIGLVLGIVFMSFVASFLGSTSLVEPEQMRIIYAANTARFIIIVGMMVFISFQMKKMFDNREMDIFFSKIPSKLSIILSFILSFLIITGIIIDITALLFMLLYPSGFLNIIYWAMTLFLEAIIMVSFSVFFAIVIRSSSLSLLISFATYFIARSIGGFIAYIDITKTKISLISFAELVIKLSSIIIPRLDLYSKSSFIVYGGYNFTDFAILFGQMLFYFILVCCVAFIDLKNREF